MKAILIITAFFTSLLVHAHGENKLGPNGGFIRMPGAFHTEVVQKGKSQIRVYLLDMEWKNPSVKSSRVTATFKKDIESKAKCAAKSAFYICNFDKSVDLNSQAELVIEASRENQTGNPVTYPLPLRLEAMQGH